MPPKNILINSTLTAGGNIHIGDIIYNIASDLQHSLLFLRIERAGDHYAANLYLKSEHAALQDKAAGLLRERIDLRLPPDLFRAVQDFGAVRRGAGPHMRRDGLVVNPAVVEEELARQLQAHLLGGDIGEVIRDFIAALQQRRLTELLLVISSPEAAIRNLPWELLLEHLCPAVPGEERRVLGLDGFGLVRSGEAEIDRFDMRGVAAKGGPLRLLFVTALPEDSHEGSKMLELEDEQMKLIKAVGHLEASGKNQPKMVIEFLDVASLGEIQQALAARHHDVIHISGHGSYVEELQQGLLYLETDEGDQHRVRGGTLAEALRGQRSLKLIVLSACETAQSGDAGSTAEALAASGVPAVLAMRFAVSDGGAKVFTEAFYTELASGESLTAAVNAGRQALWDEVAKERAERPQFAHPAEWFTPVLQLNQYIEKLIDQRLPYAFPDDFYTRSTFAGGQHTRLIGGGFVGRKRQRIRLRRHFQAGRHVALVGMGGMGKTTLAEAFAHHYDNHSHRLIKVDGRQSPDVLRILSTILEHSRTHQDGFTLYEQVKTQIEDGRLPLDTRVDAVMVNCLGLDKCILLFDNFEDLQWQEGDADARRIVDEEVEQLLIRLLTLAPSTCRLLFTTRYTIAGLPERLGVIYLDRLGEAEQYRLMNLTPGLSQIPVADRAGIYHSLCGLPRAYSFLAAIAQHDRAFVWHDLEVQLGKVGTQISEDLFLQHVFGLLNAELQKLFLEASIFFTRTPLGALVHVSGLAEAEVRERLEQLRAWSMVYWDEETLEFEVHGLTRTWVAQEGLLDGAQRKRLAFAAGGYFRDFDMVWAGELAVEYFEQAEAWEDFAEAALRLQGFFQDRAFYHKAMELCERVLEKVDLPNRQAEAMGNKGIIHLHRGSYQAALPLLERSLRILQEIGDRAGEGVTLNNLSQIYDAQGDYPKALDYLERSLRNRQEIGDRAGEGATLNNLSQIYNAQGDYPKALDYLERSLRIQQEVGDRKGEGVTLSNLATLAHAQGEYGKALDYLERSQRIQQEIGDRAGEGTTLNNISQIYGAQGEYPKALDYLDRSLRIQQEIGDRAGEGATLNNLSQIYDAQGDDGKALDYLERSLRIRQEIGDRAGEGRTLNNLGQIYQAQGDYPQALAYLERSLRISQEIGDRAVEGATLNNLSQIYDVQGDYARALAYLERSLQIRQEIGDIAGIAATLHNMGAMPFERGEYEAAIPYLMQAYSIFRQIGSPNHEHPGSYLNVIIEEIGEARFQAIIASLNGNISPPAP